MNDLSSILRDNLARVRERIAAAAARAGRSSAEITLVGVTKYVDVRTARALAECGLHDLAESRPQELWTKAEGLSDLPLRWHFVGHLQRNKLRRTLPQVSLLHSIDSLRLLDAVAEEAAAADRALDVLLEINISGDATKTGVPANEATDLLPRFAELSHVRLRGLMGMAALDGGLERARHDFVALRELRDRLKTAYPQFELSELSMGMSDDFEVAIEEGATLIRVGSALFEGLS